MHPRHTALYYEGVHERHRGFDGSGRGNDLSGRESRKAYGKGCCIFENLRI